MSGKIRLPSINASSQEGKLEQVRSYLYQLASQLNWLLEELYQSTGTGSSGSGVAVDAQLLFAQLRPLIIRSAEISDAYRERYRSTFADIQTVEAMLKTQTYAWDAVSDLTVQSRPTFQAAGDVCQNFLVFGHIKGSAVLAALTMIGQSSLLQTGTLPARVTQNGQFVISGVPGDRITILSSTPFEIGGN